MSGRALDAAVPQSDLPLSIRVVEAVAEADDVAVDELEPMHEYVDLESLEDLVASADDDLRVRWFVGDTLVEVDGAGDVRVS